MIPKQNNISILVVDNDPEELEQLDRGFCAEQFETVLADTSAKAVAILEERPVDVVLIDLMMPVTNGLQLARIARNMRPDAITILMSAYHLSPIQLNKANTGVTGFVPKPFRMGELVVFIRDKLNGRPTSPPGVPSNIPRIGKNSDVIDKTG